MLAPPRPIMKHYLQHKSWTQAGVGDIPLRWLLYDQKGAEVTETLQQEFKARKRGLEEVKDEDQEAEERELGWGWGDMERERNDEANLAERGYGE